MLILTRKLNEVICVGDDIKIQVVSIRGEKVKLGITAPTNIVVHRKEVYERVKNDKNNLSR